MDTHGHEEISKVGLERLKKDLESLPNLIAAYSPNLRQLSSLKAFYFGNWLTDMSQVPFDAMWPCKVHEGVAAVHAWLDELISRVQVTLPSPPSPVGVNTTGGAPAAQGVNPEFPTKVMTGTVPVSPVKSLPCSLKTLMAMASDTIPVYYDEATRTLCKEIQATASEVKKLVDNLYDAAEEAVNVLFGDSGGTNKVRSALRGVIKVVGYFKFAHPRDHDFSFDSFNYIFQEFFGDTPKRFGLRAEYDALQHMDRWPMKSTQYVSKDKKRNPSRPAEMDPGIYPYMRDTIEYVAGHLADLDLNWADPLFRPPTPPWPMSDENLQTAQQMGEDRGHVLRSTSVLVNDLRLAQLGHALHAVEDFFAHSTFVEHALRITGDAESQHYLERLVKLTGANGQVLTRENLAKLELALKQVGPVVPGAYVAIYALKDRDFTRFCRRLLKFDWAAFNVRGEEYLNSTPLADGKPIEDPNVVTGFFEMRDAILSLKHIAMELFGDGGQDSPQRYVRGILDWFQSPIDSSVEVTKEAAECVCDGYEWVCDKWGKYTSGNMFSIPPDVAREVTCEVFPSDTPDAVRVEMLEALNTLLIVRDVAKVAWPVYQLIKLLVELYSAPRALLKKLVFDKLKKAGTDQLISKSAEFLFGEVNDGLDSLIGSLRIGSHSLIAKDHEGDFCHENAMKCASAVHFYVVQQMLRATNRETSLEMAKTPFATADKKSEDENVIDQKRWIDWLELLEHFLGHPGGESSSATPVNVSVEIIHWTKDGDTLDSLAKRYGPSSMHPKSFTWETIAMYNYGTLEIPSLNAYIRDRSFGCAADKTRVVLSNELPHFQPVNIVADSGLREMPAGMLVRIPDQNGVIWPSIDKSERIRWYERVMDRGWRVFDQTDYPAHDHDLVFVKRKKVEELVESAKVVHATHVEKYRLAAMCKPRSLTPPKTQPVGADK